MRRAVRAATLMLSYVEEEWSQLCCSFTGVRLFGLTSSQNLEFPVCAVGTLKPWQLFPKELPSAQIPRIIAFVLVFVRFVCLAIWGCWLFICLWNLRSHCCCLLMCCTLYRYVCAIAWVYLSLEVVVWHISVIVMHHCGATMLLINLMVRYSCFIIELWAELISH